MGQALWRLPPRQQLELQEELVDHLSDQGGGGKQEPGKDGGSQRRAPQHCYGPDIYHLLRTRRGGKEQHGFIDLDMLPPELGITILSYLNATDLCLAGCVWQDLGNDEYLWQGRLYLQLDEGSLTFNANPQEGISYFMSKGILADHPTELAKFIFYTRRLNWKMLRIYLDERRDVLDELVTLHNFSNQFLPNALRDFFRHIHAPEERGEYLETLITKFSHRFCTCNPGLVHDLGLSPVCRSVVADAVYVLCYSLILLSIDLTSPHVKNKMSKREFIRNTRRAAHNVSDDFVGHLYDNIYLVGHVAA
ncbi:F-box only protein 8 isoform X3 [Melanotaenia boesemani]|uniref:F-box only protein 8 isoform X3 n=1 Tax=Melanotaenia boesemani TaxID=1250792 RepID=UPI001C040DEA|nr:F-box only protein 8 isoform X3 [Melanotaenia boesemani]